MTLSLTLPDRIGQALKNKAQEFDMQPHDWLKQMLFAGTMNKEDVPASYLLWLWDDGWWQRTSEPLGAYLLDALSALQQDCRDYIVKHQP